VGGVGNYKNDFAQSRLSVDSVPSPLKPDVRCQTYPKISASKELIIHILLHFLIPAVVVILFFRRDWIFAYLVMISTMLVDIDHILATPIYDPGRCSIGFHPLHGLFPIALYVLFCFIPKLRIVGIGLVIHMVLDSVDCQITNGLWFI